MKSAKSKPARKAGKPLNGSGMDSNALTRRMIARRARKITDGALAIPRVPPPPDVGQRRAKGAGVPETEWRLSGTFNPPSQSVEVVDRSQWKVPFAEVVDAFDLCDDLIGGHRGLGVESCSCTDVASFIWNHGRREDQVEALLAILPIARRVLDRFDASDDPSEGERT